MNLPSREERERWLDLLGWLVVSTPFEDRKVLIDSLADFLRADTLDRMAEAIRAAKVLDAALSAYTARHSPMALSVGSLEAQTALHYALAKLED